MNPVKPQLVSRLISYIIRKGLPKKTFCELWPIPFPERTTFSFISVIVTDVRRSRWHNLMPFRDKTDKRSFGLMWERLTKDIFRMSGGQWHGGSAKVCPKSFFSFSSCSQQERLLIDSVNKAEWDSNLNGKGRNWQGHTIKRKHMEGRQRSMHVIHRDKLALSDRIG